MINPCLFPQHVNEVNSDTLSRLYQFDSFNPNSIIDKILENSKIVSNSYHYAVKILRERFESAIPQMTFCLIPEFSDEIPSLSDQKIGGMPDIRNYLYAKNKNDRWNISKIWSKCGICHERMKFVGQFDLLPWLIPIHSFVAKPNSDYWSNGDDARNLTSGLGSFSMMEHASIFANKMFHVFACPFAGTHFYESGFDSEIFISTDYFSEKKEKGSVDQYKEVVRGIERRIKSEEGEDDKSFSIDEKKIVGWNFRIQIDSNEYNPGLDKLLEQYPDIFIAHHKQFQLFGAPNSQQIPRRYWSVNGTNPTRMTPFISFNDAEEDYTYQIYADFLFNDGYKLNAKVEGSCT